MTQINPNQPPLTPEQEEQCDKIHNGKTRRSATLLAALGLIAVTGGSVFALGYDAVVNGSSPSITQLSTIATLGVGGLLALAGAQEKK